MAEARAATSMPALLEAWERGCDASPGERGLILLSCAQPQTSASTLAEWPVGRRDAALLALTERLFGSHLPAEANCPRCAASLELEVEVAKLRAAASNATVGEFVFHAGGYHVTYRLPSAGDLAHLPDQTRGSENNATLTRWLVRRCVVRVEKDGPAAHDRDTRRPVTQGGAAAADIPAAAFIDIPTDIIAGLEDEISATVSAADPLAEIALQMECPVCAASWSAPFDIVSFLWGEVDAWALHVLHEVHVLASSYGWSESQILALSPKRRQHYRDLIGL